MIDTTPAAVALNNALEVIDDVFDSALAGRARKELAALSAQLEAANKRHAAALDAVARARADALKEAAKLAWDLDAKYMRSQYKIEHNRKRYDVSGVEGCEDKAANVISEDIHNAILALIHADTPAKVTVQVFPPSWCTAWEDCAHDGVCHDMVDCGAIGPNSIAIAGGRDE
jgi:hypothetical protein